MIEGTFNTWRNTFGNQMKNEWEMNLKTKALMEKIRDETDKLQYDILFNEKSPLHRI